MTTIPSTEKSTVGDANVSTMVDTSTTVDTTSRPVKAIDLAEEVRSAMATVARILDEANDLLAQLNADESKVTSMAYAAKVTTVTGGEDELSQTVASLSGSSFLHAALTDWRTKRTPSPTTTASAGRCCWLKRRASAPSSGWPRRCGRSGCGAWTEA